MIIILNGTSSSGKSTIARAINTISPTPFLHIGIDVLYYIMPPEYINDGARSSEGFKIVKNQTDKHRPVKVEFGCFGAKLRKLGAPKIATLLHDQGFDLIIDEVFIGDEFLIPYIREFKSTKNVYFIGVNCDLETLENREKKRGNREPGLASGQYDFVHNPERFYDLIVDGGGGNPEDNAKKILSFTKENLNPKSIRLCTERLDV